MHANCALILFALVAQSVFGDENNLLEIKDNTTVYSNSSQSLENDANDSTSDISSDEDTPKEGFHMQVTADCSKDDLSNYKIPASKEFILMANYTWSKAIEELLKQNNALQVCESLADYDPFLVQETQCKDILITPSTIIDVRSGYDIEDLGTMLHSSAILLETRPRCPRGFALVGRYCKFLV